MLLDSDRTIGENAIKIFYEKSKALYPSKFGWSWPEFLAEIDRKSKSFIDGFGLGIRFTQPSETRLRDAMEKLAEKAQGGIPTRTSAFTQALSNRFQEFDIEAFKAVASETASDVVKAAGTGLAIVGVIKLIIAIAPLYFAFKKGRA